MKILNRLVCTCLASVLPFAQAQSPDCDLHDLECRESAISQQCMRHEATAEDCLSLIAELDRSVERESVDFRLARGLAHSLVSTKSGSPAEQEQSLGNAERLYQSVLDDEPDNVQALAGLSTAARRRGNNEEVERLLRRQVELQPDSAFALRMLINQLYRKGRDGIWEGALVYRELYEASNELDTRLMHASSLYRTYLRLDEQARASELRNSILQNEIDMAAIFEDLSNPTLAGPEQVESHLKLICGPAANLLGSANCFEGISRTLASVPTISNDTDRTAVIENILLIVLEEARMLAPAGMEYVSTGVDRRLDPAGLDADYGGDMRAQLQDWIDTIVSTGHRSATLSRSQSLVTEQKQISYPADT